MYACESVGNERNAKPGKGDFMPDKISSPSLEHSCISINVTLSFFIAISWLLSICYNVTSVYPSSSHNTTKSNNLVKADVVKD